MRGLLLPLVLFLAVGVPVTAPAPAVRPLFVDDFEHGLSGWDVYGLGAAQTRNSGDPEHKQVLLLRPQGDALALVRGSGHWRGVRLEGQALFPTDQDSYLGVAYNFHRSGDRRDFGLIYIKGNDSYLAVNPHRDFNVGRTLYEEYRTPLVGRSAVRIGEWKRFKAEIIGPTCHVYIGDVATPQLTFSFLELEFGAVGLQPRSVGGDVWVDNVVVTALDHLSYQGPPRPAPTYDPAALLTEWQVIGPLERTNDALAGNPAIAKDAWRPFKTDDRGAVITGRVTDYHGARSVAYFRTRVLAAESGQAMLHLSSVDDLALWVNSRFHWFIPRNDFAWYDFWKNPDHQGRRIPINLVAGDNVIVVRVRGGVYASGGFFARLEREP